MPETSKTSRTVEVFISYAHEDEVHWNELSKHLSLLKRRGVISVWHDRQIGAGREWKSEIETHLNTAHIILLLVSADFLASDYCHDVEMKRALERHDAGEARVIPIILRKVDWEGALFGKLQALPKDGEAITSWPNRDEAYSNVAEGIRNAVEELIKSQIESLLEKLNTAKSLRNWPNVINLGERIIKLLPDHQPTCLKTAAAYVKQRSYEDIGGYIRVLTKRHESYNAVVSGAIAALDRAIRLDPKNAEYHFLRGSLRGNLNDLSRAIELAPGIAKYYYFRAWNNEDDKEAALRDLEHALTLGYRERFPGSLERRIKERQ